MLALLALAATLTGCGGARGEQGTATLWVTRDRGAQVVYTGKVPAGLTAMQALDRKLDITTRYGGRFVQSISGIEGSASRQRDWFWYVNGIEGSTSAAEYRLHPGDVEWWDYRHWTAATMSIPVVVGAFPEPFLHGFGGKRPPVAVLPQHEGLDPLPNLDALARRFARLLHASRTPRAGGYVLLIGPTHEPFHATREHRQIVFEISYPDAQRLIANPKLARFHFEGLG